MSRVMLDLKREGLVMTRKGAPTMLTRYARNATGSLGIVVPGECYAEIFAPIVRELKRMAERNGWRVLTESIKSDKPTVRAREARRIAYLYAKERVAGVFFQPMEFVKDYTSASREVAAAKLKETLSAIKKDGDIRLAGFDDVAVAAQIGLTTCRQPLGDLAHVALQTLLQRIKSPRLPPRTILLPAPLVVR